MSKQENNGSFVKKRKGYHFLESEIEIYNILVNKQDEGDEILRLFNIDFITEDYAKRDAESVNTIYIMRDKTVTDTTISNFDADTYTAKIQIIIACSNYDIVKATALLKTCLKTIKQYIYKKPLGAYTQIIEIMPRYTEDGRLNEYRVEIETTEIDDYYTEQHEYKLYLMLKANIQGENEYRQIFPLPKPKKKKKKKIKNKIMEDDYEWH